MGLRLATGVGHRLTASAPLGDHARDDGGHEVVQVQLGVDGRIRYQAVHRAHQRAQPRQVFQTLRHLGNGGRVWGLGHGV
jgi:hypothetical protein